MASLLWYWLTQVVPDRGPLSGCGYVCVLDAVTVRFRSYFRAQNAFIMLYLDLVPFLVCQMKAALDWMISCDYGVQARGNPGEEFPRRAPASLHRHNRYSTELPAGKEA